MGSPITFSGFNNIDFGMVLNAIMQQERQPIAAIEARRNTLQAQNSAFANFASRLGALESAVADLADATQLSKVQATSSDDTTVGVSTGSASATGAYDIVVNQLARSQVLKSTTSYASRDAVVATAGAIGLARLNDPPIEIDITGPMSLDDIADAINRQSNAPVSASVVQVAPGDYRLVLTGRSTGTANGFTVEFTTPLTGGPGLGFTDTDGDNVYGDTAADNVQTAADALLRVNQIDITSSSNQVADVVPGVTLQLKKVNATAVHVEVSKDDAAALKQVEAFAAAYNDVVKFFGDQRTAAQAGKATIGGDPLVRGLRDAMRFTLMGSETNDSFTRLAQVGIEFDGTGNITVNKTKFTEALDEAPADVQQLFGGDDGTGGRFGTLKELISGYTASGGLVADMRERIDQQVSQLGTRISTLEEQLALRRASLQREFIAADRAMSQLNNQGNSLSQLGGQYRLF